MPLHLDADQRFTCQSCGRCCRRGWDIALTPAEVEAYRHAKAARWYREAEQAPEGTELDPFEAVPGHPLVQRIRKREDGACGFLSPENRCRIHEEMGADKKPLSCRLFPFRFHPAGGETVVTASFCCPTVVANEGLAGSSRLQELGVLRREWARAHPEPERAVELVRGRPMPGAALGALRRTLRQMLDRSNPEGRVDLHANVARMADWLDDLSRHRVVRLAPDAFAEYVELTGRYAASSERPVIWRRASLLARLFFRGFLFLAVAARRQLEDGRSSGLRLGLRLRLFRLLAHIHGVGPPAEGVDMRARARVSVPLEHPGVHGLVYNYLRAAIETLGTGRQPVLDEVAIAFAFLNAGLALAAMSAARAAKTGVDEDALTDGLMEAVDLSHAETEGVVGRLTATLSGGVESLFLFSEGRADPTAAR